MAWPDDPLPAIRHELHFGDRLVRCFVERPRSLYDLLQSAALRDPDATAWNSPYAVGRRTAISQRGPGSWPPA